ncbi:hypothetical protein OGAPHI_001504 [Ogataea philodendri]|uniref:GTPase MTG2, mitochondrial n=1 Tax=Ogataea philodendri TaxID=1378263 RepID=A0A9P8PBU0_9ASCO|nr:uncharacterized protein OGAPHI_001504 [Ogataea philodendri]KAH3669383.1 hypothetical protein OGAPHI_001504 [Ogataea philodendri]
MIARQLRYISHTIARRGVKIPDNAPSLEENAEWLQKLRSQTSAAEFHEFLPKSTFEINDVSELESDANPDLCKVQLPGGKHAKIVRLPDPGSPQHLKFFTMSVPASDYSVASSPFSALSAKKRPKADSSQSFSDLKVVNIRSGNGGNGTVSFFRDTGIAVGPPNGGDGGDGGDIYVSAVEGLSSLHGIRSKYVAGNGLSGESGQADGKRGNDVHITVPVGTTITWCADPKEIRSLIKSNTDKVFHIKTVSRSSSSAVPRHIQLFRNGYEPGKGWVFKEKSEEYHMERDFFLDLNKKVMYYDKQLLEEELQDDVFPIVGIDFPKPTKKPVLLLKGGRGGMGNMHFLTSNVRNPRFAKVGRPGLEENFVFELKLLADLGLVGLPNAGKSTLLRAISNATPRVGHWAFTTLQPTIGTIQLRIDQPAFTVADIPGVVEGANENKGMGLTFLRHVERSGGIVFVISLGNENPVADLQILLNEMGTRRMENKRVLVVATKADLEGTEERYLGLKQFVEAQDWKIVPCCAMRKENIQQVLEMMAECSGKLDN